MVVVFAFAMLSLASPVNALRSSARLRNRQISSIAHGRTSIVDEAKSRAPAPLRTVSITDAIHRTIELHPLCAAIMNTPEFQRLRGVKQLGVCSYVFPCAVHDRFQHSLGVSHLASSWAQQFRVQQPQLNINDADVLCVAIAGLIHDLGHGPYSHFWEHEFMSAFPPGLDHESLSAALFDRLLAQNNIDVTPWLDPVSDVAFVKALVFGKPPQEAHKAAFDSALSLGYRLGPPGVVGQDKRFLYDIVANKQSGLDVDKLDYFQRDCLFAGVVKLSFEPSRVMHLARVAASDGRLMVCFPAKAMNEVLHVFQTRFNLHAELYQHRVVAAVGLMLRDALLLANESPHVTLLGHASDSRREASSSSPIFGSQPSHPHPKEGQKLKLSECGGVLDRSLNGFMQLVDGTVLALVRSAASMEEEEEGGGKDIVHEDREGKVWEKAVDDGSKESEDSQSDGDERSNLRQHASASSSSSLLGPAQRAAALLARIEKRELYKFVGGALLSSGMQSAIDVNGPNGAGRAAGDLNQVRRELFECHCILCEAQGKEEEEETRLLLSEDDLRAEVRLVSYGSGTNNPLDRVRFFSNKALHDTFEGNSVTAINEGEGRGVPEAGYSPAVTAMASLPRAFEERTLRVFLASPPGSQQASKLAAARAALEHWADMRGLLFDH